MKRFLLFASALAGLFLAASCQQETLEPVGGNAVTFTVLAPGQFDTKAKIADGENVNEVLYEIYKTKDGHVNSLNGGEYLAKGSVKMENKKATVTFDLLQDQEYTVIFWAQVAGKNHYNTSDLRLVSIAGDPSKLNANVEDRAAFYRVYEFETPLTEPKEVKLYRPFSQINLGTTLASLTPIQPGQTEGYEIDVQESYLHVKGLSKAYNTVEHKAEGAAEYLTEYTFASKPTPYKQNSAEKLEVNGVEYHYVGMNYVFVPENEKLVELDYTITTDKGLMAHDIINVPLKKNYRTNIVGNLLTKDVTFEIVVDENFDGDYIGPEFVEKPAKNDAGEWVIETPYELAWLAAAVNGTLPEEDTKAVPAAKTFEGETFILNNDLDLKGFENWTPIGATGKFLGTFDGQEHTISNLTVEVSGKASAGLFANCRNVKNVNMSNVKIKGQYKAGAITGDALCAKIENCHVDGLEMVVTPYMENDANNVGGIAGYLSAEPVAYIKGCSVTNATIAAYRKVGGIVGAANGKSEVSGNTVSEITVTADQTSVYNEVKAADAGAVVGYAAANAVVTSNIVEENVEVAYKVDSSVELNDALKNGPEGAVIEVAAGSYDALANVKNNVTIIGAGYEYSAISPVGTRFYGHSVVAGEGVTVKNAHFANPSANWVLNYQNAALHNVTFEKCWFNDTEGIRYAYAKENVTFTECIFGYESCSRGVHFDNKSGDAEAIVTFNKCTLYGFQALGGGVDKFIFNNCTFAENTRPQNVVNMYNYVEYNNCTFNPLMHCDCAGNGVTAAFNGCSYTDGSNITSIVRFDKDPATCTITFDGIPYSDAQNMTNISDGLWSKTGDNGKTTYVALNANGLVALSATTIEGGETVELGGDIDLAGVEFAGLNAFNPETNNTFDGKGHTVSNWTYTGGASDMGFIKNWVGSIKNVTIEKASLKTSGRSAVVAAKVYANIENCHVVDCSIEDSYWACGLIAGLYNGGSVSNCSATNSFVKSNGGVAAIVGVLNESAGERSFTNCKVEGCTVNNTGVYGESYSGALVCGMLNISNSKVNFNGCQILNNTKEGKYVGDLYYATSDDVKVYVNGIWDGAPKVKTVAALQDALKTNESDVVVAEEVIVVAENEEVELDLNGKTLTAATSSAFQVNAGGKLTLKNGNVKSYEAVVRTLGGEVVIESGKYVQTGTAADSPSTYRYAVDAREGGKVTIKGGEFESGNGLINVNSGCEVVISGGKFTNKVKNATTRHLAYVSGKLTINDGEFYGEANSAAGGCFFCGAAAGCDITINGGKFTSLWTSGSVNRIFEVYYGGTINVTGGMFNANGGIASFVEANTDAATKDAYPYVAK